MFFRRDHRCEGEPRQRGNLQFHLEGAFRGLALFLEGLEKVSLSGVGALLASREVRFP